jgi:hypothetical protein
MKQDITEYVKGCADCQCHKVNNQPTKAPLQPIYPKLEAMPFETVTLDFIVKLPILSRTHSFIRFSELKSLSLSYDKMVSHMIPYVH